MRKTQAGLNNERQNKMIRANTYNRPAAWKGFWSALGYGGRIALGSLLIILVGWLGLGPAAKLGLNIPWPFAIFWAAVGWSRAGWQTGVMIPLIGFGLVQDIALVSPIGAHFLVYGVVFVVSLYLFKYTQSQRSTELQILIPAAVILFGFYAHWTLAALITGMSANALNTLASCLFTIGLYYFIEPVFDIRDPLA